MELIKFDEVKKTWQRIAQYQEGDVVAAFELEVYKKMLDIFQVGAYYYYIFNLAKAQIEFVSDGVENLWGILRPAVFSAEYIYANIHPDDKLRFITYEKKATAFFEQLAPHKIKKYKMSYDYRICCADGSYKWILQQVVVIQTNEDGAVIRVLGIHTDISAIKKSGIPADLSFCGMEGEPSYQQNGTVLNLIEREVVFSKREKEVLQLIVAGFKTPEIACKLSISEHTVNTHRKNLLARSGCKNLVTLVAKAVKDGWI